MRVSNYFLPILKEKPIVAAMPSHVLMLCACMIKQSADGVHYWLPLGVTVLNKISSIVRAKLNEIGILEVVMPLSSVMEEEAWQILKNEIYPDNYWPKSIYQIQWKLRGKLNTGSCTLGSQVLANEMYSFDLIKKESLINYEKMLQTYLTIFRFMGLDVTSTTIEDEGYFSSKQSKALGMYVQTKGGDFVHPEICSYHLDISYLLEAVIEKTRDPEGIVWPNAITPFECCIINLETGNEICDYHSEQVYEILQQCGFSVLYCDTHEDAETKFANMALIGIPVQIIIAPKKAAKGIIEVRNRKTKVVEECDIGKLLNYCQNYYDKPGF